MKRIISTLSLFAVMASANLLSASDNDTVVLSQLAVTESTVPPNGDLNPYGVAFVPDLVRTGGALTGGDVLVSNFNASSNLQGTGTTIVRVRPHGRTSLFFQSNEKVGLTTALWALRAGFVLVGNVPTTDGTSGTIRQGSLIIIDRFGNQKAELKSKELLDGPWDLTAQDNGSSAVVFVSNVLSGTVTRINLQFSGDTFSVTEMKQIASGYPHRSDPNALVVGPTGLAYDATGDVLYVASTDDNKIYAVDGAGSTSKDQGTGHVVIEDPTHLHGPLGLVRTRSGHLIVANGDAVNPAPGHFSELEEYSPSGDYLASFPVDFVPGAAFGIALVQFNDGVARFAAVDDNTNAVTISHIEFQ